MLRNRKELIELIEFGYDIKEIINLWDPLNLLSISPEDEYETEIRAIRNFMINNRNIDKKLLSQEIRKIFKYYFLNDYNPKQNIEENIASRIIDKSEKYKINCTVPNYYETENIILQDERKMEIQINLYIKIHEIINLWDPLKIMDISFKNEYSYEINRIIEELLKNITIQNLSREINKIFKSSYNGIYNAIEEIEIKIAEKIIKEYCNIL